MRPHRPGGVHQCGLLPPRPFGALQALRSGKAGSVGGLRAWAVILGWMCSYMWVLSSPHICHFIRSFEFLFWHQRSFAQSFSKWSFPLPTHWSIALNTTIRMCRIWQFAKCSGASESNQSCANWPPMRGCSQSRPSPCSAMTSQPSRLLWRLWSQTQPRSALTFQNKSSRWPLWRRSGRHAALCKIISPLGEPRWKKIHQRFQRFPEKIMQNFVKFLSLDTLTCSSLCIGSHIASLLREFSATSLCTASSTSTKSERSGRGMSRSHRRQGWRRTQKICSVSSWSINLLLQAQSLRSWTSCTHSSSRSSTSTFVSSRSRPAPWSTCLSSKNGAKRTGAWLSCSPWILWSARRCTVSVQISASSSALSPRRCSKCSPTISSYGTMLAQAQSSTSSSRLPTQLSQSRPRSAHGQAQQMLLGPPRSPRRTKLGGSARRPSSRRQRRCSTILPSHQNGQTVPPLKQLAIPQWDEVEADLQALKAQAPFFLELFAGEAGITEAVHLQGISVLPPVDITPGKLVQQPKDIVDLQFWKLVLDILAMGIVLFLHCGTPCNTFTAARKLDGGPPPLRSAAAPLGLDGLSWADQLLVFLGNLFLERTVEACVLVFNVGGDFLIENPLLSLLWLTPQIGDLIRATRAFALDCDQCAFGTPWKKPTRFLCSTQALDDLCVQCPGTHKHEKLQGKVWHETLQRWVFRTKGAQVYPWILCSCIAVNIKEVMLRSLRHLHASFALEVPAADRKRALLSGKLWAVHRQAATAQKALQAGYQLKRGATKPLLEVELEPGQAVQWVLSVIHPFTCSASLPGALERALVQVATAPAAVVQQRAQLLQFWHQRALALLPRSVELIMQQPDPALRKLLLNCDHPAQAVLGRVCHVALYDEMLAACGSVDRTLPSLLLQGFPIVGPTSQAGRWPPYDKPQKVLSVQHALDRAWDLRSKIVQRVRAVPVTENLVKIWEATLEDVQEGSCLGPFATEQEITELLGQDDWIPTQRFEVVQKNKVRGCDSATTNLINQITEIKEKLQLPSTDSNVAALRKLRTLAPEDDLQGWVLDERKAYRQIAVRPDHRKFSVICLKSPCSRQPAFFVMVGHSFGLVSAVYNYNRRSAAINEFLVSIFGLVAFSFYDDKYGFETSRSAASARHVAECVHWWLGASFDQKKLQLSETPTILGVTYNLKDLQLEIKAERKVDLLDEIDSILAAGCLDPGSAGKLKGKLMFGASQLWGKVGRAFLRPISERQYFKFPHNQEFKLDPPLVESLVQWRKLIEAGPPRPIDLACGRLADAVIFTDGFTPDPRSSDRSPDRIGGVLFDRRWKQPRQFTAEVPAWIEEQWLERTTQIMPIEMIAPVVALSSFSDRVVGADIILLIDSEAVEAALVKGYSSREDMCHIISVFWDLALELRCRIFIDRVSTDANPADWPSRSRLDIGERAGWSTIDPVWPKAFDRKV